MIDLRDSVVAILDANGRIVGTGFLTSAQVVLTCAHVVEAAGSGRDQSVSVRFFASGSEHTAQVLTEGWSPVELDDVAVLQVDHPPDGAVPAILGAATHSVNHQFSTLGFPLFEPYEARSASGHLGALIPISTPNRRPLLQLQGDEIAQGMSGAPVLDLTSGRIVGMISEYRDDERARFAYATTADTLAKMHPRLRLRHSDPVEGYLTALREYCANLPYLTLHDIGQPKTLDQVYVPLKLRPQRRQDQIQPADDEERLERGALPLEPLSIAEVIRSRDAPHILILGEPGAGKSTLLRQMAARAWDAPQAIGLSEPHLPLLVPLRQLVVSDGSLDRRLSHALASDISLAYDLPDDFLAQWPQQTGARWLILFDALDEVPDSERARLMQWLKGQLENLHEHLVVVTSRPTGYKDDFDAETFGHYGLLPFTPEHTGVFAHKWFNDKANTFLMELDRIRASDLRGTPLLLTISAKVFSERGALPGRRSALYGQFVTIWLEEARRRDERHELGDRLWDVAFFILARLALPMSEQPEQLSEQALSQVVVNYLISELDFKRDEAEVNGRKAVQVLARRSGLLTRRGNICDFIHPTFREYLTAFAVARKCNDELECVWEHAVSRWQESSWRETALFALSILGDEDIDVTPSLERIRRNTEQEALYFVGTALAEQAKVSVDFASKTIDALLKRVRTMTFDSEFEHSPNALTILADMHTYPRAGDGLLRLVRDARKSEKVRRRAVSALGRLGRGNDLWDLASDEKESSNVRVAAARALGRLGRDTEAVPIVRVLARDASIDGQTRVEAAAALGKYGHTDESVPILLELARRDVPIWVRIGAIRVLGQLGRDGELSALGRDESMGAAERVHVAKALNELGQTQEAVSILSKLAWNERLDAHTRAHAVEALGEVGQVVDLLALAGAKDVDAMVRVAAAAAVGKLGKVDESVTVLLELARNERVATDTRTQAVRALGELGRAAALSSLVRASGLDDRVRAEAAVTLGRSDHDQLLALIRDTSIEESVRAQAVWELSTDASNIQALAQDPAVSETVRLEAVAVMHEMGWRDKLLALALDEQIAAQVRIDCIRRLAWPADDHIIAQLVHIARKDKDKDVRRAAQEVIQQIHTH